MSSRASETPPSSRALQRRLVVDRKQCVYSDLPKRSQWSSDESTLCKKQSSRPQKLSTSKSHDKVVQRPDISGSSVATSTIGDTPISPPYRRQSVYAMTQRESPLRKGAESYIFTTQYLVLHSVVM